MNTYHLPYLQYSGTVRLALFPMGAGRGIGVVTINEALTIDLHDWDRNSYAACLAVALRDAEYHVRETWYWASPYWHRDHLINLIVGECRADVRAWQQRRRCVSEHMMPLDAGLQPIFLDAGSPAEIVIQPAKSPIFVRCGGLLEVSFAIELPDDLRIIAPGNIGLSHTW